MSTVSAGSTRSRGARRSRRTVHPRGRGTGEISDHLGYDKHDAAGKKGGNSRNDKRSKTVLTDVGPVEITVPRDRDGSFEPKIVKKRQRRLTGVDEMVISLAAKGLATGEVQAHLAEVYGAEASRQTISTITDKVLEDMAEWQGRRCVRAGSKGGSGRRPRSPPSCEAMSSWPLLSPVGSVH